MTDHLNLNTMDRPAYSENSGTIDSELSQKIYHELIQLTRKPTVFENHLVTGDQLIPKGNEQTLKMPNGEVLNLKKGDESNWSLTDHNGNEVKMLPQYTKELRIPQWYDLSDGGKIIYHPNRTDLSFPNGDSVSFDGQGVLSVTRGEVTQTLRKPAPLLRPEFEEYFGKSNRTEEKQIIIPSIKMDSYR